MPSGTGLIVNGDFSLGNTAFTTDYTYSPADIGPAQTYAIVHSPADARPADHIGADVVDHTTGTGLLMAVNESLTPNLLVWGQTAAVDPNTTYHFSAFVASWFPAAPSHLDVLFNGSSIGTIIAPSTTGVWVEFTADWNSGSATSATIDLRNLTTADVGGDFALDDISLAATSLPPNPPPTVTTTIGPGDVIAGASDGANNLIAVDLNSPATLGPGSYLASEFNYEFANFGFVTQGTITPILLTGGGTSFTPIAVGSTVTYTAPTGGFVSAPFGGTDTFTLTTSTTVYGGLFWDGLATPGGPELRMPVGYAGGGDSFVVYGGGTGPGANPPAVGTLISGTGQGFFSRIYDFSIGVGPVPQRAKSVTTGVVSPEPSLLGQAVTLTATVGAADAGFGTPSGSVDFFDNTTNTDLGTVALSGGTATLNTATLSVGQHSITTTYLGDSRFLSSAGSVTVEVIPPASLSGTVFEDFNNDGQFDFGEEGIAGVTIILTGTDDLGNAVSTSMVTDADGAYIFASLRPGSYAINETQPAGYTQGINTVGTWTGTPLGTLLATDQFSVTFSKDDYPIIGTNGINYNFGERPTATGAVQKGQTAGIGFWNNKNGQALISAFNGGTGTQLADWLAATLPHIFGIGAGANKLAGKSNAYVAALFQSDFLVKGQKLDAQVLATALSVYATNAALDGTGVAANYGFTVSGDGAGTSTFNIGSSGDAFGVANNTTMTVMDLLLATDAQAVNGVLYNGNGAKRSEANALYSALNQAGSIG